MRHYSKERLSDREPMNDQEYIEDRLNDQIAWYESKANRARRNFKVLRATEFVSAALVPVAVVLGASNYHRLAAAFLGALAAAAAGFQSVNHYQENWVSYRAIAERLKSERYAFLTKTAPYDGSDALQQLVANAESLMCGEHDSWGDRMAERQRHNRPNYSG